MALFFRCILLTSEIYLKINERRKKIVCLVCVYRMYWTIIMSNRLWQISVSVCRECARLHTCKCISKTNNRVWHNFMLESNVSASPIWCCCHKCVCSNRLCATHLPISVVSMHFWNGSWLLTAAIFFGFELSLVADATTISSAQHSGISCLYFIYGANILWPVHTACYMRMWQRCNRESHVCLCTSMATDLIGAQATEWNWHISVNWMTSATLRALRMNRPCDFS